MKVNCPICQKDFGVEMPEGLVDATMDCPHCCGVIRYYEGKFIDFHKSINENNPEWPADGKGTGSFDIE